MPINIMNIRPEDISIFTFCDRKDKCGAGWSCARCNGIKILHKPSGFEAIGSCRNNRSQHRSKAQAMELLKEKLENMQPQKSAYGGNFRVMKTKDITLGTRVRIPGNDKVWVLIEKYPRRLVPPFDGGNGKIISWIGTDEQPPSPTRQMQEVCCIVTDEDIENGLTLDLFEFEVHDYDNGYSLKYNDETLQQIANKVGDKIEEKLNEHIPKMKNPITRMP